MHPHLKLSPSFTQKQAYNWVKIAKCTPDWVRVREKLGVARLIGGVVGADVKVAGCCGGESDWKARMAGWGVRAGLLPVTALPSDGS